jgi:serine/threonine protein kinase
MPPKRKPKKKSKKRKKQKHEDPSILFPVSSIRRQSCEIAYLDYKQGKTLGQGGFGTVYELCESKHNCPYVLKVQNLSKRNNDNFTEEVENQKKAHKFAPKIHDAWMCVKSYELYGFIVMDKMDGTLLDYVAQYPITQTFIEKLMKILVSYVNQLHNMNIAHNDLNFENIFYKGRKWYLGDFGQSSPLDAPIPESLRFNRYYRNDGGQLAEIRERLFYMINEQ